MSGWQKPLLWDKLSVKGPQCSDQYQNKCTSHYHAGHYAMPQWEMVFITNATSGKRDILHQLPVQDTQKMAKKRGPRSQGSRNVRFTPAELPMAKSSVLNMLLYYTVKTLILLTHLWGIFITTFCSLSWKAVVKVHCMRVETWRRLCLRGHCEQQETFGWVLL